MTDGESNDDTCNYKYSSEEIMFAFRKFIGQDCNQKLITSVTQLQDFAFELGETWSEATCQRIIDVLDANQSGTVEIDEFANWLVTRAAVQLQELDSGQNNFIEKASIGTHLLWRAIHRKASRIIQNISNPREPEAFDVSTITQNVSHPDDIDVSPSRPLKSPEEKLVVLSEASTGNSLHSGIPMSQTRVRM